MFGVTSCFPQRRADNYLFLYGFYYLYVRVFQRIVSRLVRVFQRGKLYRLTGICTGKAAHQGAMAFTKLAGAMEGAHGLTSRQPWGVPYSSVGQHKRSLDSSRRTSFLKSRKTREKLLPAGKAVCDI